MVTICHGPLESFSQLSPFPEVGLQSTDGRDLPEILPPDLIEPVINPRQTSADRIARLFNRDLRDLEEAQDDIVAQLDALPRVVRESQRVTGFGYHSGSAKKRPKWLQIDMEEVVSPDAIALFPVTAELDDETVYGYGFPRNFRVDISDDEDFRNYETMVEGRVDEPRGIRRWPFFRELSGFSGRYIRITATGLWRSPQSNQEVFALSEVMVLNGGRNLAVGKEVLALDSEERSDQWSRRFVTDGITTLGIPHGVEESPTLGFRARSEEPVLNSWVQVALREPMRINEVQLILADSPETVPDPTVRFPYPMKIEVSTSPDMLKAETIGRFNPSQISIIGSNPLIVPTEDAYGKYIRVTVVGSKKMSKLGFELAEIRVFSDTENVALGQPVNAAHTFKNSQWAPEFLVDGYSSRRNLVSYGEWLSDLDKRNRLVRRWLEKENTRLDLVDATVTRGVTLIGTGVAGILGFVLVALSRGRVRRRKDLEALRQRIASDLHDDIGSNLSSIALLAELGKTEADEPDLVEEEFTEIKSTADKTIESMRDIVWLIRPGEETWQQMLTRFRETAAKLLRAHEYSLVVKGDTNDDRLPLEFKRDIFLIYKEVLNNIVRHAEAENVDIEIDCRRNRLQLSVKDDGIGFNNLDQEFREGNGLRNLRMRAQAIGANLRVRSALTEGTSVQLVIPMP
ncbi:MAG: histidine kinase [Verrucomicrobiales bacterium]|nr:histidine kinase [Verrucomicrobiales bacterium]